MEKELRFVNHEKVILVQEYRELLSEIKEYLAGRYIIALDQVNTVEKIDEEKELMFSVINRFEVLIDKHNCDLNKDFYNKAKVAIKDTKSKLLNKQDSTVNVINYVSGLVIQFEHLMLEFRDKIYDNLK